MARINSIWDEMRRMQEQMDSLFDSYFGIDPYKNPLMLEGPKGRGDLIESNYRLPLSDIYETEKEVIAEVELPGLTKNDIKVNVCEDSLEIKAETKKEKKDEDKKQGIYRYERNFSGFYRQFSLPSEVDSEKSVAEYKDGVLKITMPKLKIKETKKKMLEIK
ncbi:MAG TPA: Hsp20/alpha crystallin family protein [Candidatus Woesearchaeota archaeon]|nr:Hsp20/alpha crystallin family protein [Candidatus Woesearchaeota archaeon]